METYFGLHALEGEWHSLLPRYLLVSELLKDKQVLEVGCSYGIGTALLEHLGATSITAVDHRSERIQSAQQQFGALESCFRVANYASMELEDDSFDVVLCLGDDCVASDPAVLSDIQRVLRSGGLFITVKPEKDAYGLDKVLPRRDDPRSKTASPPNDEALNGFYVGLKERFKHCIEVEQLARLSYSFHVVGTKVKSEKNLGDALQDEHAHTPCFTLALCTDASKRPALPQKSRAGLPYYGVATRLGQHIGDLYRHLDDLSQTNLLFEGQLEDKTRLIDDLEEEVRSQRDLSKEQATRLEQFAGLRPDVAQSYTDLTFQYARLQSETAARNQELLDITATFTRQLQESHRSLQEREDYIKHLTATVSKWETYSGDLERDVEARELAMQSFNSLLQGREAEITRLNDELDELRPELHASSEDDAHTTVFEAEAELEPSLIDSSEAEAMVKLAQAEAQALEAETERLAKALSFATVALEKNQAHHQQSRAELKEKTRYVRELQKTIEAKEAEAQTFTEEVAGIYEKANDLQAALNKANATLDEAEANKTKSKSDVTNLELELQIRGIKILKLERELMGKKIEVSGLERENIKQVTVLSERNAENNVLKTEITQLKAKLGDLHTQAQTAEKALQTTVSELEAAKNALEEARQAAAKPERTTRKKPVAKKEAPKAEAKPTRKRTTTRKKAEPVADAPKAAKVEPKPAETEVTAKPARTRRKKAEPAAKTKAAAEKKPARKRTTTRKKVEPVAVEAEKKPTRRRRKKAEPAAVVVEEAKTPAVAAKTVKAEEVKEEKKPTRRRTTRKKVEPAAVEAEKKPTRRRTTTRKKVEPAQAQKPAAKAKPTAKTAASQSKAAEKKPARRKSTTTTSSKAPAKPARTRRKKAEPVAQAEAEKKPTRRRTTRKKVEPPAATANGEAKPTRRRRTTRKKVEPATDASVDKKPTG